MFDRLDDLLIRYEELLEELNSPDVAMDQNRFRKLMKEQADLTPLVDAYKEYKKANQDVEDSLALLEEESDEEMRDMAKEELADAKKRIEERHGGNPCRRRRRRSSPFCLGALQNVCAFCGEQPLEDGACQRQ